MAFGLISSGGFALCGWVTVLTLLKLLIIIREDAKWLKKAYIILRLEIF